MCDSWIGGGFCGFSLTGVLSALYVGPHTRPRAGASRLTAGSGGPGRSRTTDLNHVWGLMGSKIFILMEPETEQLKSMFSSEPFSGFGS